MNTTTINLGKRAEKVRLAIAGNIDSGKWPANSRLPTVDELCEIHGVSRSTIQKVLARLANDGMIRTQRGSGCFVNAVPEDQQVSNTIALMFNGTMEMLTDIQDIVTAHGCMLTLYSQRRNSWQPKSEAAFLQQVLEQRPRALLAFCSPIGSDNRQLLKQIADNGTRVIHVEYFRPSLPEQEYVLPDYVGFGRAAAVAALMAGYQRLYYVGMKHDGPFGPLMRQGVENTLHTQLGSTDDLVTIDQDGEHFYFPLPQRSEAPENTPIFAELAAHVGDTPAAFICNSADRARIVRNRLQEQGLDVPGQVGVVGIPTISEDRVRCLTDCVEFDALSLYRAAIKAATDSSSAPVRQLLQPRVEHRGTLRR